MTASPKTIELFKVLKERFDCIIIDSSPVGLVSDTYYLAAHADACLLVVRPDYGLRDVFENTIKEINAARVRGLSLVINDVKSDLKKYGYGEKYGYTSEKEARRKSFLRRRKTR